MRRGTRCSTHFPALAHPPVPLRTERQYRCCREICERAAVAVPAAFPRPPVPRCPKPNLPPRTERSDDPGTRGSQARPYPAALGPGSGSGAATSVVFRASAVGLTHYPRCRTIEDRGDSPLRWRKGVREEASFLTYYFIFFLDCPIFIPYMSSCQRPNCARRARGRLFRLLPTSKATIPPSPKGRRILPMRSSQRNLQSVSVSIGTGDATVAAPSTSLGQALR